MSIFNLIIFFAGMLYTFTVGQLFTIESILFGLKEAKKETAELTTKNYENTSLPHHHEQECVCIPFNLCTTYAHKGDIHKDKRYNAKYVFRQLRV